MRIFIIIFCLFIFPFYGYTQGARGEDPVRVTGRIYNAKTMDPVPYANMVDISRNIGTAANENAEISFIISKTDTMRFTAIGFEDAYITLKDSSSKKIYYLTIKLIPKSYMLEAVEIYANDPMAGFRRDTTHITKYQINPGAGDPTGSGLSPAPVGYGYITAFANLFNRHYQQEKKLGKILEAEYQEREYKNRVDSIHMVVNARYNKLVVSRITDLTGNDLDNFIKEYRPSDIFILTASEYEFALQIVNSFRDYRKKNGLQVDLDEILRKAIFKN